MTRIQPTLFDPPAPTPAPPSRLNPPSARLLLFASRYRIPLLRPLLSTLLGCDIACDLSRGEPYLPHPNGVMVHPRARLGRGVTLMQQVTLGSKDGSDGAPLLGDHVFCGAGCKVLGPVVVGTGAIIGANAVVTRNVPPGATVVGANRILRDREAA